MTQDEIIEMARQAGFETMLRKGKILGFDRDGDYTEELETFAKLVAAKEREAIAQMFEHAPVLVDYAKNYQGGCLICGFTPELAIKSIRVRGET